MAALSPRCIQQLPTSPKSLLTKPSISSASLSPNLQLTLPSSFSSELGQSPIVSSKAEEQSSSIISSPTFSTTPPSLSSPTPSVHTPPPQTTQPKSWVATLLKTKFYGPCSMHSGLRKNDLNLFCIDHAEKICQYCHQAHHPHKSTETPCTILHVSRYMYHDVLLAKEASALLDITEVQSYLNNGNRVVYIDRRAQPKSKLAPHAKSCVVCSRTLQDPYRFCSLFCRLQYANDPAAVESIPLPNASPLLHQVVKKVKKAPDVHNSATSSATTRLDRNLKRTDRSTSSSPTIPVISRNNKSIKTKDIPSPLRLTPVKKSRRKSTPHRSPLSSTAALMLSFEITSMLV